MTDKDIPLTLNTWLRGIPGGVDRLTAGYHEDLFGLGDLGEGRQQGKKVDPAPNPGGAERHGDRVPGGRGQGLPHAA